MVGGLLAVQALQIVQTEGWFEDWLWPVHIARAWLACGREGILLARAVRIVWEEEAALAAQIAEFAADAAEWPQSRLRRGRSHRCFQVATRASDVPR